MATGTTEFIDSTTADALISESWSPKGVVAREAALVFARKVDLSYRPLLRVGDILNVHSVTNLTASTKTKASNAAINYETQTETTTQITVATWGYQGIAVESIVDVQAIRDQAAMYAPKQGFALGLQVDDTLAGHIDDMTNPVGTLASTLAYTDWTRAMQYLDDANASDMDRCIIASPAECAQGLLQMDQYIHNDYSALHGDGPRSTRQEMAYVTSFLTYPVYKSTNVEGSNAAGHDNTVLQKEAIALILHLEPRTWTLKDPDYLVRKIVLEQIYGSAIMRADHAVFARGA